MDHKIGKIIVHLAQILSAVKEESWFTFPRKHCCAKNVFSFLETEKSSNMRWHPLGKHSWGNCGRVTLEHGLPWDSPDWLNPEPRVNPAQPGCAAPAPRGRAAGWGAELSWDRGGRACWYPQSPDHTPISDTNPLRCLSHSLALMCSFPSCSNGSSTFASIHAKKAAKVTQKPPSWAMSSYAFILSPLKYFSWFGALIFPGFYPMHHKEQMLLLSEQAFVHLRTKVFHFSVSSFVFQSSLG